MVSYIKVINKIILIYYIFIWDTVVAQLSIISHKIWKGQEKFRNIMFALISTKYV